MNDDQQTQPRVLTGWHIFFALAGFFGVIIAVNMTLAVYASRSWTGLVVKSSYVASQDYNQELAKANLQKQRGWRSDLSYQPGRLTLVLVDKSGDVLTLDQVSVHIGRPAHESEDQVLKLEAADDGTYRAPVDLAPGIWLLKVIANAGGVDYRRDSRLIIPQTKPANPA